MTLQRLLYLIIFLLCSACNQAPNDFVEQSDNQQQYDIGESLQKEKSQKESLNSVYQHLDWEAMSPQDWDPLAAIKGLDLENLDDTDPRAMAALTAVGEAWKNAPIVPALGGQRISIAGFVVPLDITKNKVKEFLLVPYFGACIHIPPPPSNQTIHAFNTVVDSKQQNKILKDAALIQGPVVIYGVMETLHSSTEMGTAGYQIQLESIEEYKAPDEE